MKKLPVILTSCLILLFIVSSFPCISVLSLCGRKNPAKEYFHRIKRGDCFVISYTHSVNKGRVHDIYQYTGGKKLLLDETEFVSYGAGIPELEENEGAVFYQTSDSYVLKNLKREMESLVMAVGLIANHTIKFGLSDDLEEIPFTKFFEAQTSVVISIKKVNLIEYLIYKI
jgi:hypothetical protein